MDINIADLPAMMENGLDFIKNKIGEVFPLQAKVLDAELFGVETLKKDTERRMQWKIENTGVTPIPAGCSIRLVQSKYDMELAHETPRLGEILPGASVILGMNFQVPNVPDKYNYGFMFKLVTPSGEEFGPELIMEFNVEDGSDLPYEAPEEEVEIIEEEI